jgi:hypothetical protein
MNSNKSNDENIFTNSTNPTELDFLHVSLLGIAPGKLVEISPHRVSINIKYTVRLSEPGSSANVGGSNGL